MYVSICYRLATTPTNEEGSEYFDPENDVGSPREPPPPPYAPPVPPRQQPQKVRGHMHCGCMKLEWLSGGQRYTVHTCR